MKLWYSKTSPYVRKVMVILHHHQLLDKVTLLEAKAFSADSAHNKDNLLGRIPALYTEEQGWLFDSRVIVEYLDSIGQQQSTFVTDSSRWQVLKLQAFADGIADNAIPVIYETLFRKDGHLWLSRQQQLIARTKAALDHFESNMDLLSEDLHIGNIALITTIDWLIMRQQVFGIEVTKQAPKLFAWVEKMNAAYPCLQNTRPPI